MPSYIAWKGHSWDWNQVCQAPEPTLLPPTSSLMSLVLILICGDTKTQTGNQGPGSHAESAEGRESDPLFSLPPFPPSQ